MIAFEDKYQKAQSVITRQIAGEVLLVPLSQKTGEVRGSIFTLNETAARAWDLIDGNRSLDDVLHVIVTEFEVEESQAKNDLEELFLQLGEMELVWVSSSRLSRER
jgi:hypothetical protein